MIFLSRPLVGFAMLFLWSTLFHSWAAEGTLTVRTHPEGIEVWLDDNFIGDSPVIEKKLKPGRYSLKLIDPIQHTSLSEEVFIQSGESTIIEKTVKGKFGSLRINSDPEGADVHLTTTLGKTPLSNDFMNPGKYRLEIRHPSKRYRPEIQDIVINRGKTVNISKSLEKKTVFNTKTLVRLGFGAGAIISYVWAVVEQGNVGRNEVKKDTASDPDDQSHFEDLRKKAATKRTFGIILGSACVVGFEIIAFF
ncbi:MAG: PEGA domain-containing protein [Chitinivibrionales bacterium]|nr:PEGA domain-containing protein [Chitinivibrionales bacterium]